MTPRENYVSIARRTGYEYMPVSLNMSPSIRKKYEAYTASHDLELPVGEGTLSDLPADCLSPEEFRKRFYASKDFRPGTAIDGWGVAHEPGSEFAYHR